MTPECILHLVLKWNLEILVRSKLSCVSSDSSLGTICCVSDHNSHNLWRGYRCLGLNKNSDQFAKEWTWATFLILSWKICSILQIYFYPWKVLTRFAKLDYSRPFFISLSISGSIFQRSILRLCCEILCNSYFHLLLKQKQKQTIQCKWIYNFLFPDHGQSQNAFTLDSQMCKSVSEERYLFLYLFETLFNPKSLKSLLSNLMHVTK